MSITWKTADISLSLSWTLCLGSRELFDWSTMVISLFINRQGSWPVLRQQRPAIINLHGHMVLLNLSNLFPESMNFTCFASNKQMRGVADRQIEGQMDGGKPRISRWQKWETTEGAWTRRHPSGISGQHQEKLSCPVAPSRSKASVWPSSELSWGCNRDISHIFHPLQRLQSGGAHVGYGSALSHRSKQRRAADLKDIGS